MTRKAPRPDRDDTPETAEQRRTRVRNERLGAFLFIFTGFAAIVSSVLAVRHGGILAEVKLRAGDYGLPWFIVLPIGFFGVIGGIWAVRATSRER